MATITIGGQTITVPYSGDYDSGSDYDTSGALNQAGYLELKDPGLDWFRQTGQGNFANPTDYWKWVYGGGNTVAGPNGQQWFQTPNGLANVVNQPLDYNEQEFADIAWIIPAAIATFGLAAGAGAGAGAGGAFEGAGASGAWGAGSGAGSGAGIGAGTGGGMFEGFGDLFGDLGNWFTDEGGMMDWWGTNEELAGDLPWGELPGAGADGTYTWSDLKDLPNMPNMNRDQRQGFLDMLNNGGGNMGSLMSLLGPLFGSALGLLGSNAQADAYKDVSQAWLDFSKSQGDRYFNWNKNLTNRFFNLGKPYRTELRGLMNDPSSFLSSEYVQDPLNQSMGSVARALSMSQGNPALSGTALTEMNNYAANNLFSRFGEFAGLLGGLGQMGLPGASSAGNQGTAGSVTSNLAGNAAGSMLAGANQAGGPYNAIGYGLNSIMNNPYGMGSGWGGWKTEFDGSGL